MPTELPWSPILVGKRIRHVRHAHGLSQSQFVRTYGGSVTALSKWERGRQQPKIASAVKIVDAFDLTLDYLFLGRTATLRHSVATHLITARDMAEPVEWFPGWPEKDKDR